MTRSFFAALVGFIAIVLGNAPSFAQNAYIPNGNSVSVIHTPTSTLGAPIPIAAGTTGTVAVAPAGRKVYVGTGNGIAVIDTLANAVVATIPIGASFLAVGPYGRRLYAVTASGISVIATETGTVIGTIPVDGASMVVSPDGRRLYVVGGPNNIFVVDTETYALIDTITVQPVVCNSPMFAGYMPDVNPCTMLGLSSNIAISPDGSTLYIGYAWDFGTYLDRGSLTTINTATYAQTDMTIYYLVGDLTVSPNGNIYAGMLGWPPAGAPSMYVVFSSAGNVIGGGPGILIISAVGAGMVGVTPDETKVLVVGASGTAVF